jgi:ABC-type transport system involved in multi-copper enzyme maturation permease subunit
MNLAVCKNTWKELSRNKLRLVLLTIIFLFPLLYRTIEFCSSEKFPERPFGPCDLAIFFVLVWGVGTIGRQLHDGTMSLVLSRPITITQFVYSKWFAVGIASSITAVFQLLSELTVAYAQTPDINLSEAITNGVERVAVCFGLSAVLMLFSSMVTGVKDLGLYLMLFLASVGMEMVTELKPDSASNVLIKNAIEFAVYCAHSLYGLLNALLVPKMDLQMFLSTGIIPYAHVTLYLAIISASLSLAIYLLNRRDLPYGSG